MYIYRMVLKLKYVYVVFFHKHYTKPRNSDCFQWPQKSVVHPPKPNIIDIILKLRSTASSVWN
jgi:hypothetical protein